MPSNIILIENTKLFFFFFGVCIYIYITYQIKKCVHNKKACVYVYVRGCFDKYISVTTWPPQIKIPYSAPDLQGYNDGKGDYFSGNGINALVFENSSTCVDVAGERSIILANQELKGALEKTFETHS